MVVAFLLLGVAAYSGYQHLWTTPHKNYVIYVVAGISCVVGFIALALIMILMAMMRVLNELYRTIGIFIVAISASIATLAVLEVPHRWLELGFAAAATAIGTLFIFIPRSHRIASYIFPYCVVKIDDTPAST